MSSARFVYELSRAILADRAGFVAVFKVYMDESGVHAGSPVVTVGAYVARPLVWQKWTKLWNAKKRPVKVFHSADCAALHGEFEGWDKPRRDEYVAALLPVIGQSELIGHAVGIRLNDFAEVAGEYPELGSTIPTPVVACFQWVVQDILAHMNRADVMQRVAFLHEENDYQQDVINCFSWLRKNFAPSQRGVSLAFASKADYVPLQAADVLAYEANKRFRDPERPDRRAWVAINPSGERRAVKYFDKASLRNFAEALRAFEASKRQPA